MLAFCSHSRGKRGSKDKEESPITARKIAETVVDEVCMCDSLFLHISAASQCTLTYIIFIFDIMKEI